MQADLRVIAGSNSDFAMLDMGRSVNRLMKLEKAVGEIWLSLAHDVKSGEDRR